MKYSEFRLENGLRVLFAPIPAIRSVTCAVMIAAGSRWEGDHDAGVAHFAEHLLFKGTKRRPTAQAISETLERVGGVMNAGTDKETTVYWTKTATEHLDLSLDLLADMVLNSRLTPAQVGRERAIIIEELAMSRDDPQDWVHGLVDESLWPGHPLGRDVAGSKESVARISRAQIRRFMQSHYGPDNAVLVVAGGTKAAEVRKLANSHFGQWAMRAVARSYEPAPANVDGARAALEERPTEQLHLCLAFPGMSRYDPERHALDVLTTILGGTTSSRLFLEVRERRALAYDVHMYSSKLADTGSVVAYAGVDARKGTDAIGAITTEFERICRRSVSQEELRKTIDNIKGRMYLGLEDSHSVASWLGSQELLLRRIQSPEEVISNIERVTPEDIRRVARRILDPNLMHIAAIGPSVQELGV
jgi:predicted Zn-dependent peptidase